MNTEQAKKQSKWVRAGELLADAIPTSIIGWFENKDKKDHKGFATKAIVFVIIFLALASITNLSNRAYEHHGDWSAYLTGTGIAVLVPLAVLAAMMIRGNWAYVFWAMALVFATVSGTIQFSVYLDANSTAWAIMEAIAFGYGVPLSEVMLAVMEARLVIQQKEDKDAAEHKIQKEAESDRLRVFAEQQEAIRSQQQLDDAQSERELKRQRQQAELEAYKVKLAQDAELERERVLAELRIKEQKAATKLSDKLSEKVSTGGRSIPESVKKVSSGSLGKQLVIYYKANPGAKFEDAAKHVGWSVPAVSKEIASLADISVFDVKREGRRKVVTVNGRHEEYLNA